MKTYYKSAILLILLLPFTSCKKGLLDVAPPDRLSTTVFWTKPSDADLILTGCYNTLLARGGGFGVGQYTPYAWDTYADDVYDTNGFAGQSALNSGINPQTGNLVSSVYTNNYQAIAYANYLLANVSKVLTGDQLKQYQGEAYFLRAFNYFWLAQLYGNVIISTQDLSTGNYAERKAKSTRADVMKQVESDLDLAIANLPDVAYSTGHAVKSTAQGYKVRALLYEKKYQEAATLASQIIASNKNSLSADYSANFYKPGQNTSPEIMFSVKFMLPNIQHTDYGSVTVQLLYFRNFQATQNLVDEYETADGKFINDSGSGYNPANPANNRDPRLRKTFFFDGDTKANGWPFTGSPIPNVAHPGDNFWILGYYLIKKWNDPSIVDPIAPKMDDADFVLLRFADILLMQAEAENEANGPTGAYASVNKVRARAGMPALPIGLTQAQMRDRIRHERRVEFATEGSRYFDLRRWGIATQKLNGFVSNPLFPNVKSKYQDNYDFWPLPQTEVDRNAPQLVQNPGY